MAGSRRRPRSRKATKAALWWNLSTAAVGLVAFLIGAADSQWIIALAALVLIGFSAVSIARNVASLRGRNDA